MNIFEHGGRMKSIAGKIVVFVIVVFGIFGIASASSYQVTFETTDCNGDTGFSTVGVEEIFKIQAAGCSGPDGKQLKQMLIHDGSGSYNAYTLTEEEARNVNKEIKAYMAARRKALEQPGAVIVKP